jgi:hypothetical protein
MSKLTQIENALLAIDPATHQRLCDSYLHCRGYDRINPIGVVIGADKIAKGTPDTLITRPDGKYVFAEYTTQQDGLEKKFMGDLAKCFDETKTGIPVDRIHEIVLCHTSRLTADEEHKLGEECRNRGVLLSIYGPGSMAHDLYQKYRGLARDFLQVEVDTGQIVSAEEFVAAYNKSSFATRLDTTFRFREDDVNRALVALESGDLAIIAGRAGVGKTRLALECCRRYADAHPNVQVHCIFHRGPNIFEDLHVHFGAPGHYLIMVDDANRVNRFEYALQLLHDQRDDQTIKIVATVRDYALRPALDSAQPFGGAALVELQPLNEEQIKELASEEFDIHHHLYLERIAEIAQGNPRLAVMAASLAMRENTIHSIRDVTALYDEYFATIRRDLGDLTDTTLLWVAGIITFFRAIDRSNAELMGTISDTFGISPDVFWQAAQHLHELEAVDMYENEIVKVSDQVLSTYLFYLSVFRNKVLDYSLLLEQFFPRFRSKLIDSLNPVLVAFDGEIIGEALRPHIDGAWRRLQELGDVDGLLNLIDVFWFVKQTDALVYVAEAIRALESEPRPISELQFVKSNNLPPTVSILGVLDNFRYAEESVSRAAVSLLLDYLEKRPAELQLVLRMLVEGYGMKHLSYLSGFYVERNTSDVIWERSRGGEDELASRIFLATAGPLLHTHFTTHEAKGKNTISIIQFDAPATPELLEFRRTLWQRVFSLYQRPALREAVLSLIQTHSQSGYQVKNKEVIPHDAAVVQPFLDSALDPTEYRDCVVVHGYLDMLDWLEVEADEELRARFTNETFALSELLFDDRKVRRELGWEEYDRLRRQELVDYAADFGLPDYDRFFENCEVILQASDRHAYEYQIHAGVVDVLLLLAERDPDLFAAVLDRYLHAGNSLNLGPWALDVRLVLACGPDRAYEILSDGEDYPRKMSWLFGYFRAISPEAATAERFELLYGLYGRASWRELPRDFGYLLKFTPGDEAVVLRITRTLVAKAGSDPGFGNALEDLFSEHWELHGKLKDIFAEDVGLLKEAYFCACEAEHHTDYSGHAFGALLDLDPDFGREWVARMFAKKDWISRRDDSRNYMFLWRRDDHRDVIERLVEAVRDEGREKFNADSYLENFFIPHEGAKDIEVVCDRQDAFLDGMIERRHSDRDLMETLFSVIKNMAPERRRGRLATFLRHNQDFEDFAALPLESNLWSWSGSAVPMFQRRVDFFESLLPMLNTVELLRHKQRVERVIQGLRDDIEREKKRDFIGDW